MIQAKIAGLKVVFYPSDFLFFDRRLRRYSATFSEPADLVLSTEVYSEIAPRKGVLFNACGSTCIYQNSAQSFTRVCKDNDTILWEISYNSVYSDILIRISKEAAKRTPFSLTQYEYILTGIAFSDRISYLNGLVMHGSAISYNNSGIIFSGPSGAGKSTQAHLWRNFFESQVEFINDDKPAITFIENRPCVCGTMWSGKSDLNNNLSSPVKAIFIVKQTKVNHISRLNAAESLAHLTSQLKLPYYDSSLGKKMFDRMSILLERVPFYLLSCNMDTEAVDLAHRNIFNR